MPDKDIPEEVRRRVSFSVPHINKEVLQESKILKPETLLQVFSLTYRSRLTSLLSSNSRTGLFSTPRNEMAPVSRLSIVLLKEKTRRFF